MTNNTSIFLKDLDPQRSVVRYIISLTIILIQSCASISPPPGGPKDTKPPKLLATFPKDGSLNFKSNKIIFFFNEKVDVSKLKDKVVITPYYDAEFDLEADKKTLVLRFEKPFKKNETYSINFIGGIKDVNEGNILPNLKLVFSTGSSIDSAYVTGKVLDGYSKKPHQNNLVGLYIPNDTLNPEKDKPVYFTYTNKEGQFNLSNLKKDKYELFTFNDDNKNLTLQTKNEKLGFLIDTLDFNIDNIDSLLVESSKNDIYRTSLSNRKNDTEYRLILNEAIYKYNIDSNKKLYHELSDSRKEIIFYKTELCEDSVEVNVHLTDSSYNDTTFTTYIFPSSPKKFKRHNDLIKKIEPDPSFKVVDSLPITIYFNEPVVLEKDSSIMLISDSISFKLTSLLKNFKGNSANTAFKYTFYKTPQKFIQLNIKKSTFLSSIQDTNKQYTIKYDVPAKATKEQDESNASLVLQTDEKNFITELLNEKSEVISKNFNDKNILYKNIKPGNYTIRIVLDKNGDKKWDTGNYKKRLKHEKVIIYRNILIIKKNWDIDELNLSF